MIIRARDTLKLIGVLIMSACAVSVCALFINSNIDLARIKDQITDPEVMAFYDVLVQSGNVTSAISGGALLLTTIIMLFFYIKHYIDTHKSELGILKALGYSDFKIAKGFWVFGLSVFAGTSVGFGISWCLMPMFYKQMRGDELLSDVPLPDIPMHFNPELVLFMIIIPSVVFAGLSILYSLRKLKSPALELITGKSKVKIRKSKQSSKEQSFLKELRQNTVRSRKSLVFLIGFSAFCYSDMIQMSISMTDTLDVGNMMTVMMAGIGILLGFTTLYIAVTTVIKANSKTIAMLRIFGYSDRECKSTILNGYRFTVAIGFIIGTIYQYFLLKTMITMFYNDEIYGLPDYSFDIKAFIITLVTFVPIYETIMYVYSKRLKRISLKEVMQSE